MWIALDKANKKLKNYKLLIHRMTWQKKNRNLMSS